MNYDLEAELRKSLYSSEELIWTGKPKTGIIFKLDTFSIAFGAFSLVIVGLAFLQIPSITSKAP